MKVLHLINTLSAGGAELHLLTLGRHLKQQGLEVMVVCLREHVKGSRSLRSDFERANIRVVSLQANSRYDGRFLGRFARLLQQARPDILHTHLPRADLVGAFARLLYPAVPWVCSVHDIYAKSWSGRWTLPLFKSIWAKADRVVAISHAVRNWLVTDKYLPIEKVTVIHYGIEPDRFSQPSAYPREIWQLNGCMRIGSIGRLESRKGHDCLIRAMSTVCEQVPNASLFIAGHDPWGYGRNLQALIEGLGLKEHVQLIGFQDDVASFLRALDVFAFASRSEGFGQVVIEAMAMGKPVVASKIPPLTEIVVDGETGLLVEPEKPEAFASAISWLLSHPDERRRMGKQGQERVRQRFSAQRMLAETLSLYNELIGEHYVQRPLA